MARWSVWWLAALLPAVFGAPTVHLQDAYHESATSASTGDGNALPRGDWAPGSQPAAKGIPHIVEPTWITVTGPPPGYRQPAHPGQPSHVMQPYYTYVPVPPVNQPWNAPWPMYYPSMPVLPPPSGNHLCNQQQPSPYRAT